MVLIAGSDATSMRLASMELFRAGHVPVMVEWLAAPLVALSGLDRAEERTFDEILHPLSERVSNQTDVVAFADLQRGGVAGREGTGDDQEAKEAFHECSKEVTQGTTGSNWQSSRVVSRMSGEVQQSLQFANCTAIFFGLIRFD